MGKRIALKEMLKRNLTVTEMLENFPVVALIVGVITGILAGSFILISMWPEKFTDTEINECARIAHVVREEGLEKVKSLDCRENIVVEVVSPDRIKVIDTVKGNITFDFSGAEAVPVIRYAEGIQGALLLAFATFGLIAIVAGEICGLLELGIIAIIIRCKNVSKIIASQH